MSASSHACPNCGAVFDLPPSHAQAIACPKCGGLCELSAAGVAAGASPGHEMDAAETPPATSSTTSQATRDAEEQSQLGNPALGTLAGLVAAVIAAPFWAFVCVTAANLLVGEADQSRARAAEPVSLTTLNYLTLCLAFGVGLFVGVAVRVAGGGRGFGPRLLAFCVAFFSCCAYFALIVLANFMAAQPEYPQADVLTFMARRLDLVTGFVFGRLDVFAAAIGSALFAGWLAARR